MQIFQQNICGTISSMKKYTDKIFLLIFFVSLIIPIIKINTDEISTPENRNLTKYKPFYNREEGQINFNYGTDFNNWFNDRFLGRLNLIRIYKTIDYILSIKLAKFGNSYIDKKQNIIYDMRLISDGYNEARQKSLRDAFNQFNKYCKEKGIKVYYVLVPRKEMVYRSDIVKKDNTESIEQSIKNISNNSDINLIFLLDDYIKNINKNYIFYATDTHPTFDGAFIGYKRLMNEIQKDFSYIKIADVKDFDIYYDNFVISDNREFHQGVICYTSGIPEIICQEMLKKRYKYYKHKNAEILQIKHSSTNKISKKEYYYPEGSDAKCLLFGDSTSENLAEFLPYSFKHMRKIRLNGPRDIPRKELCKVLKYYENEITEFKPDIIVFYLGFSQFSELRKIMDKN